MVAPGDSDSIGPRVLLVDDDEYVRDAVLAILVGWRSGATLHTTSQSGVAGAMLQQQFDLLLLDAGSSDAAAIERLKAIKRARPDIPVIMLSRHGDEQWAVHAIQAGAVDYVPTQRLPTLLVRGMEIALENSRLARDLERLKIDLVGMVSHDIRAPAANIVGIADLALLHLQRSPGNPVDPARLDRIRENGLVILRLIDDLLDMARIEYGALRLTLEPHDVADVLRESVERCNFSASQKSIRIRAVPPAVASIALLDRGKIVQVLANLMSNAIKFSHEGTEVTASAEVRDSTVTFRVTDQGQGIRAEEVQNLFKRFSVTSTRATRGEKGSGLGLYIVHQFTKLHDGSVDVESSPEHGSEFRVSIPRYRSPTFS